MNEFSSDLIEHPPLVCLDELARVLDDAVHEHGLHSSVESAPLKLNGWSMIIFLNQNHDFYFGTLCFVIGSSAISQKLSQK